MAHRRKRSAPSLLAVTVPHVTSPTHTSPPLSRRLSKRLSRTHVFLHETGARSAASSASVSLSSCSSATSSSDSDDANAEDAAAALKQLSPRTLRALMSHSKANQRQTGHGDGEDASQRRRSSSSTVGRRNSHHTSASMRKRHSSLQVSVGAGSGGARTVLFRWGRGWIGNAQPASRHRLLALSVAPCQRARAPP